MKSMKSLFFVKCDAQGSSVLEWSVGARKRQASREPDVQQRWLLHLCDQVRLGLCQVPDQAAAEVDCRDHFQAGVADRQWPEEQVECLQQHQDDAAGLAEEADGKLADPEPERYHKEGGLYFWVGVLGNFDCDRAQVSFGKNNTFF